MPSTETGRIHEIGVHRHGSRWLHANRRAVEAAQAMTIGNFVQEYKNTIAMIVLKVLDGEKLDTGFVWSKEADKWVPRVAVEVSRRLIGLRQDDN